MDVLNISLVKPQTLLKHLILVEVNILQAKIKISVSGKLSIFNNRITYLNENSMLGVREIFVKYVGLQLLKEILNLQDLKLVQQVDNYMNYIHYRL